MDQYAAPADASAIAGDNDAILYESERTRVWRRPRGALPGLICKQTLGPGADERLRHESRILARLAGVDGVPRLAAGVALPGVIVLDDCEGVPLAEAQPAGGLALPALLELALQLTAIVAGVHRAGVLHKDINPANIVLAGAARRPLLIDFDLATTFAEEAPAFTHHDGIAGTLAYLAPEQSGRTGRPVDQRADLYALGATLYQLATGQPPFPGHDPLQLIRSHLAHTPAAPLALAPQLPPLLSGLILRLLEKEPERRYQSAEGLAHDLARLAAGASAFALGACDFPRRLAPPARLAGREREIAALRTAFTRALGGGQRGVLVAGAPGVGKTALVNELRAIVTVAQGWFVSGKFDQYQPGAEPASLQALSALGRLLLAEPETALAPQRERLLQALGPQAGAVTALLPEFAILLGPQPQPAEADPGEAVLQQHRALATLLRAVVSPERPLVMVLDDLQWAPPASLRFIDHLLTDDALHGLLLVGAYRDAEIAGRHPLAAMLPRWEGLGVAAPALRLDNLAPDGLGELLAGMLRLAPPAAAALADDLLPLAGGNPYDTVALVNALRREGVLALGEGGWRWDPAAVRRYVDPGGVLGALSARIASLPAPVPQLLESMACLGGEVAPALLCAATGLEPAALEEALAPALEDGLLVWSMDGAPQGSLRFRHDRVQQAAHERLGPERLRRLHLALARRLAPLPACAHAAAAQYLAALDLTAAAHPAEPTDLRGVPSPADLPSVQNLPTVQELPGLPGPQAVPGLPDLHGSPGLPGLPGLPAEPGECRRVLALFQAGAAHARQVTTHGMAERFLSAALALAAHTGSGGAHLRLALEQERHAALFQLGRLAEADDVYARIAAACSDPVQLAEPAALQICSLMLRNQARAALALGLPLLRALGMALPEHGLAAQLPGHLDDFYRWCRARDLAADLARPAPRDARRLARVRLARQLIPPALFSDPAALAWLVLESQRSWEQEGPCPELMFRLCHAGVVTIAMRQDYRTGYEVQRHVLALGLARGYTLETWQAGFLLAITGTHWFEPLEHCVAQAQSARDGLLQGGDWQVACYNYYTLIAGAFDCGARLDDYAAELEAGTALAVRLSNQFNLDLFAAFRQVLHVLRGDTPAAGAWDSDAFDEAQYLDGLAANPLACTTYHYCRALNAALFGDTGTLSRHIAQAMEQLAPMQTFYPAALCHALQALALAHELRAAPAADADMEPAPGADVKENVRADLLARFDACRDWLAARAADAPVNFSHLLRWLAAERAWAVGDAWSATAAFDNALVAADSSRRPWHRAFITERAALFHLAHGQAHAGRRLLAEAHRLYADWGAHGKARQLEQAHGLPRAATALVSSRVSIQPRALADAMPGSQRGAMTSLTADSVDLLAILRASQALSSETSIGQLRARVSESIGAMTGATSVMLALREGGGPWLLPPADDEAPLPVDLAGARGLLPLSAFRYVERTLAPLLVADATRDDRFARDPYVAARPHCSLLLVPILSHGAARAILLLENTLGQEAFSAGRLDAVMLVAGQLAVSLENAQLYAALERKVAERTAALEEANQRLALLSTTDALTGLANRRRFNDALEAEWLRSLRPHSSIGAVMIDIDQFKLYNDHYGHQQGDACLRLVATTLAGGFRQGMDLVARYGGEEFAAILPGADLATAWAAAERARLAVAALRHPHLKATHGIVTISMGVAAMAPVAGMRPEQLFSAADGALYRAKQQGRNRVERG